jgi:hypothetical protein
VETNLESERSDEYVEPNHQGETSITDVQPNLEGESSNKHVETSLEGESSDEYVEPNLEGKTSNTDVQPNLEAKSSKEYVEPNLYRRTCDAATIIDGVNVGGETNSYAAPPAEYEESYAYETPHEEYAQRCNSYIYTPQAYHFQERWINSCIKKETIANNRKLQNIVNNSNRVQIHE